MLASHPGMVLEEVCEMCGYYDTSYFIRVFKKQIGLSPGERRDSLQNGKKAQRDE